MLKKRILLASLLKPVNGTRMFEKTGRSLAKLPDWEVHIAGQNSQTNAAQPNIYLHPIFNFSRLSWKRLQAHYKLWKLLLQLKPAVIIPNTYEFLPVTVFYKLRYQATIIYDVRENYYANIRYQPTFPKPLRRLLANTVRLIERTFARWVSHFWLAESCYAAELPFVAGKAMVLENKYQGPENPACTGPVVIQPSSLQFLYSGTISEVYGIFEAIELTKKLHKVNPNVHLTIIGYCPLEKTLDEIRKQIEGFTFITLIGGRSLVPHPEIIKAIHRADVGLLPYRKNQSTWHCRPTKLFEYAANGLPCLVPENPSWEKAVKAWEAGFSIDFQNPDAGNILERLTSEIFYRNGIPKEAYWQEEEQKMLSFFSQKVANPY